MLLRLLYEISRKIGFLLISSTTLRVKTTTSSPAQKEQVNIQLEKDTSEDTSRSIENDLEVIVDTFKQYFNSIESLHNTRKELVEAMAILDKGMSMMENESKKNFYMDYWMDFNTKLETITVKLNQKSNSVYKIYKIILDASLASPEI